VGYVSRIVDAGLAGIFLIAVTTCAAAQQPIGEMLSGAIQVVRIPDVDPNADWSKINISTLREHLIDMNEVTLHAAAMESALDNGIEIAVIGEGVHALSNISRDAKTVYQTVLRS
jgi:hypothetical protein